MPVYRLHGLRMRSAVALAGEPADGDAYDVHLRWTASEPVPATPPAGRLVAAAMSGDRYLYVAVDDGDGWTLRVPGYCDFVIDRGRERVECRVDPAADPEFVAVLASGILTAFVLSLAGDCVLHASAVEVGGAALAIAGPSGSGKSTLAALLCSTGARMVTDDLLRVGLGLGTGPVCVGGSPHLRIRSGAAWVLERFDEPPASTVTVDDRLAVRVEPAVAAVAGVAGEAGVAGVAGAAGVAGGVPLAVIVVPRVSRDVDRIATAPITGGGAVAALMAACRMTGWVDPVMVRQQFHGLAELAGTVPVVEAVIPWGLESRPHIVRALLELLPR